MATIIDTATIPIDASHDADTASWLYNALDCFITADVYNAILPELDEATRPTYELSRALQAPILDMNMHGILVDQHSLTENKMMLQAEINRLETQLDRIMRDGYGTVLNWRSPQQLANFLYNYLQLPRKRKRNAKGEMAITTDRKTLEGLSIYTTAKPFINHMLALRDLAKRMSFLSTEIDNDGYMRCNYNIAGTNTGRLSSSFSDMGTGTNLQNVDGKLRRHFVAPKGKKFANLDLEQADSRNVGATCWNRFVESHGEEWAGSYLDACESGDLHTMVTRMARPELEWPDDKSGWRAVADQQFYRGKTYRDVSKGLGHGTNYLLTPESAVQKVNITIDAVKEFRARYFGGFPCIPEWHKVVAQDLINYQCLTTIWGFQRYFFKRPDDPATHRAAVAFEGQSPTASEINHGLLQLWREGRRFPGFQLLVQVHDSIMFQYDEECEDEIIPWALQALRVPLILKRGREFTVPTEAKIGWNWGDVQYWNKQDYENGKCKKEEIGKPKFNFDGLAKWKGHDTRTRQQEPRTRYSLR